MMTRRRRRAAAAWRELLERQAESGLSVDAFCRSEDINRGSFYVWRSRLRREDGAEERRPRSQRVEPQRPAGFIDLGALSSGGRFEVRLDLGGGVVLHLARG
jgi:transposase-like protein